MEQRKSLWTKNFTIITLGSVISMFGDSIAGFAMGLLILDYSESTLLYAMYMVASSLPKVFMPTLAGPYIDKFSRKKTIYTLDFLSAITYLLLAVIMFNGWLNYGVLIICGFVLGAISSVYTVAYTSFYPLLITEGNYSKAYSIESILDTMSMFMIPVSLVLYYMVGMTPLFIINMVTFLIAAILETRIEVDEEYVLNNEDKFDKNDYKKTFKEGVKYLKDEKGLGTIIKYCTVSSFTAGVFNVLWLPYFKINFTDGMSIFINIGVALIVGRVIGGSIQCRFNYPTEKKFSIAMIIYCITTCIDAVVLYLPIKIMSKVFFIEGIMGVTSYNIRISGTQSYVPDDKKGRFNGMFQMCGTIGALLGQFIAGLLSVLMKERSIIVCSQVILLLATYLIMYRNKEHVKPIFNRKA